MRIENSYYDIACNDFMYFCDAISPKYFNQVSAQAQQIAEKMLKSVADLTCVNIEKLMLSRNLRAIYDAIHEEDSEFNLDRRSLALLKDYYYDARYPGDNFVTVTKEEFIDLLNILMDVIQEVETWRSNHDLPCQIKDPSRFLHNAFLVLGVDRNERNTPGQMMS